MIRELLTITILASVLGAFGMCAASIAGSDDLVLLAQYAMVAGVVGILVLVVIDRILSSL